MLIIFILKVYHISCNDTWDNIKNFICTFFSRTVRILRLYIWLFDTSQINLQRTRYIYILLLIDSHLHKMISFGYHNGELFPILVSQISLSLSLSLSLFLVIHILAYWLQYRNLKCPLYYACMSFCVCVYICLCHGAWKRLSNNAINSKRCGR